MEYAVIIFGAYLLGSVPFGLILTRLGGYGDIRAIGSGNIGATNVLRTGNKKLALATLVLDGLKGIIAVVLTHFMMTNYFNVPDIRPYLYIAGFFAIIGHLFPVWLKFKGGKGVATTLGTLIALHPVIGIAACGLWLLTAVITRYSSLSALIAIASAAPIAYLMRADYGFVGLCLILFILVSAKHHANIKRLIDKTEPKIGQRK